MLGLFTEVAIPLDLSFPGVALIMLAEWSHSCREQLHSVLEQLQLESPCGRVLDRSACGSVIDHAGGLNDRSQTNRNRVVYSRL